MGCKVADYFDNLRERPAIRAEAKKIVHWLEYEKL